MNLTEVANTEAGVDQAEKFLEAVHGDHSYGAIVLSSEVDGRWLSRWMDVTDLHAIAVAGVEQSSHHNVWVSTCLLHGRFTPTFVGGRRGNADSVIGIGALWADIDVGDEGHATVPRPPDREMALATLEEFGLAPSIIVDSGHGLQGWWLTESATLATDSDRQYATALTLRFQEVLKGVWADHGWTLDSVSDLARVLRLPGTTNFKTEPVPVFMTDASSFHRYTSDEVTEHLDQLTPPPRTVEPVQQEGQERANGNSRAVGHWHSAAGIPQVLEEGVRRKSLLTVTGYLRMAGLTTDEMLPTLTAVNDGRAGASGPLPMHELEALANSAERDFVARPMPLQVTREDDGRFHFWTPGELLDADRDFRWLVGGLLVQPTYGMLAGESKTLKTHFETMIALGIASGRTILDQFDVPEARPVTLYIGEGGRIPHTRLLERVAASMGIDSLRDLDLRVSYDVAGFQSERFQASVLDDLKQREPGFIGIDPLYAFHGTETSASSLHEEGALLSELHTPINEAGATLQIVNHFNKTGTGGGLRRITQAGSAEWSDSWILVSHRSEADVEAGSFHLTLEVGSRQWGGRQWDVELELGAFSTETMEFDGDISWTVGRGSGAASSAKDRQRDRLRLLLLDEPRKYSKAKAAEIVSGGAATFRELWAEAVSSGELVASRIDAAGAPTHHDVWSWVEPY